MGDLSLAIAYPLRERIRLVIFLVPLRLCPRGTLIICTACGRSTDRYYAPMLNHKSLAQAGLLWCPQCYEGRKGRRFVAGHLGHRPCPEKGGATLPLQKPGVGASSSASLSGTPCSGTIFENFPTLWEFLTLSRWPDATSRKVGSIILFVEGDRWKACLKDPNGPRVAFVTGEDIDSLLLSVDAGLDGNKLDWRPDRPKPGGR